MRSNKIDNADLFTRAASENYKKHIKTQSKAALGYIDKIIDWSRIMGRIEKLLKNILKRESTIGRKRFSLEVIVRCFIIQYMYGLSDPRLEEEIADRRSFQIFLGLTSGDSIPDETTICRYRELFSSYKLDKWIFNEFNKQLKRLGIIVGKGTIVDATIKEAQAGASSERDKDANHTIKRGKLYYGYKGHISMDEDSEVIKELEFTKASVHDSDVFEELVKYDEEAVYGDKGYSNKKRREKLQKRGIFDGILTRGSRHKKLSSSEEKLNKILSGVRNKVERPFAYMKRVLGYSRCSYYDLRRNRFEFVMCALIYNIRRLITLTR